MNENEYTIKIIIMNKNDEIIHYMMNNIMKPMIKK